MTSERAAALRDKRAEIWRLMKEWLAVGALAQDEALAVNLTSPEYGYTVTNAIQLERKDSMKARGLASPDTADALACTFAVLVPIGVPERSDEQAEKNRQAVLNYDPIAAIG